MASKKLNASPVCCANHCEKNSLSTPGTGSCDPIRITTNIARVKRIFFLISFILNALIEAGIVKNPRDGVKILGNGELTKKLNVKADAFSASAKEKIEALGGTAEVM